ncbi:hypothetical protein AGMMS50230_20270 [Spirochaetia bacterium]|nr:hypothetical protein AGMMS50230_20270 [Spirochaetia bacterium]
MEDSNILQHLLEIEANAAVLVDDAQAEADRRIKAAEEQNRLLYEKQYQSLVAELEAEYGKEQTALKARYEQSLDEYRQSLDALPLDKGAFSALAYSLLLGEK